MRGGLLRKTPERSTTSDATVSKCGVEALPRTRIVRGESPGRPKGSMRSGVKVRPANSTCVGLPRHGLHRATLRGLMRSHPVTLVQQASGENVTAPHHILSIRGGEQRTVTVLSQQDIAGRHAI